MSLPPLRHSRSSKSCIQLEEGRTKSLGARIEDSFTFLSEVKILSAKFITLSACCPDFPGVKTGGLMVRRGCRGGRDCGREWNRQPTPMANREERTEPAAAVFRGKNRCIIADAAAAAITRRSSALVIYSIVIRPMGGSTKRGRGDFQLSLGSLLTSLRGCAEFLKMS